MAFGKYRRLWHKYLPLAVLNHNTSYHVSIGCEPTRAFHTKFGITNSGKIRMSKFCLQPNSQTYQNKIRTNLTLNTKSITIAKRKQLHSRRTIIVLLLRGNMPIPTNSPNGEQPVTSNDEPRDADEYEVDYLTTRDGLSDVTDALQRRNERLHDDVSKRNNAIQAERNEYSNGRTRPSTTKIMKNLCRFRPKAGKLIQTLQKKFF